MFISNSGGLVGGGGYLPQFFVKCFKTVQINSFFKLCTCIVKPNVVKPISFNASLIAFWTIGKKDIRWFDIHSLILILQNTSEIFTMNVKHVSE